MFFGSTQQNHQLIIDQHNFRKEYRQTAGALNVSKSGMTNLKTLAALLITKGPVGQVQVMAPSMLCIAHFYETPGNQLAELCEN